MSVNIETLMAGPYSWEEATGATSPIVLATTPVRLMSVMLTPDNAYRWVKVYDAVSATNRIFRVDSLAEHTRQIKLGSSGYRCRTGLTLVLSSASVKAYALWLPET